MEHQSRRKRPASSKKRRGKSKLPKKNPSPEPTLISEEELQRLLEPYSKSQLINFLVDAALSNPSVLSSIHTLADRDVSHRKLFVYGLSWDATPDDLRAALSPFGQVEDCHVVLDKTTGRAKGFAFVQFATRAAAVAALEQPQKKIRSRIATFQLASVGPVTHGNTGPSPDTASRRLYVSNVPTDAAADTLRDFFAMFGEIETGPHGYDSTTGKSRGYALFVYKTPDGLRKALEEPYKIFEGHQLHCKKALESGKGAVPASVAAAGNPTGTLGAPAQQVLAAVAAAQKLALLAQNPAYTTALLGQNPLLAAAVSQVAALNPVAGLNPAAGLNAAAVPNQSATLNPVAMAALSSAGNGSLQALGSGSTALGPYGPRGVAEFERSQHGHLYASRTSGYGGASSLF